MLLFFIVIVICLKGCINRTIRELFVVDDLCLLNIFLLSLRVHDLANTGDSIVLLSEVDKTNTLCGTPHHTYIGYLQTNQNSTLIDNHQVVLVGHHLDSHQTASLLSG